MRSFDRRKVFNSTMITCLLTAIAVIFLYQPPVSAAGVRDNDGFDDMDSDSTGQIEYPERMKDRETWEWILSSPGLLINLPFAITLKVTEKVVSTVYQPRMVGWMYDLTTSDDSTRAIRPAYSSRSGLGIKIYQKEMLNEESKIELSAKAGFYNRQKYRLSFEDFRIADTDFFTDFSAGYRFLHNQEFYGIGPDSRKSDQTDHALERWWLYWDLRYRLSERLKYSVGLTFEHTNILQRVGNHEAPATIEVYDASTLPGLENEVRILGYTTGLEYDSRNSIGGPRRGQRIRLNSGIYEQVGDDRYEFWKINGEIRQYIHLFAGRVIQLRLDCEINEPISDKEIPFYYLGELGWMETIRGYPRGRFWDKDMLLGSIEYRWPIWHRLETTIDAFLFYDFGQVANDIFRNLEADDIQHGFGGGFRVWNDETESLYLVFAGSNEDFRVFLGYNK